LRLYPESERSDWFGTMHARQPTEFILSEAKDHTPRERPQYYANQ